MILWIKLVKLGGWTGFMKDKIKYSYAATLLLSILIYSIPFQFGGYIFRILLAIVVLFLVGDIIRIIWNHNNQSIRNYLLLGILNSFVLFHLALIFSYLMFDAVITLLFGIVFGVILYFFISNRINQVI